jgi:hypothetical protein
MEDILIKFDGKSVACSQVGSKNPMAAMIAQMMMSGQEYGVAQARDIRAQAIGAAMNEGGIAIG